jgi:SIR2-like domain
VVEPRPQGFQMLGSTSKPLEAILLTGAGFTKNFGGFLADEMRAFIVNKVGNRQALMALLNSSDLDYESVYVKVIYGDYSEKDKSVLANAAIHAYQRLDDAIRGITWNRDSPHGVNLYGVKKFLDRFGSTINGLRGYFFTLNQDLFIERWYGQETLLKIPGNLNLPTIHVAPSRKLEGGDYLPVPAANKIESVRAEDNKKTSSSGRYHYLKLHGSFNWLDDKDPGKRIMVIGGKKWEQIQNIPILHYYHEKFREVLTQPSRRLCIIGYSFRDEHINKVISEALTKRDLKLFVICPQSYSAFARELTENDPDNGPIIQSKAQYWPWELREIYPFNQAQTVYAEEINSTLFD